MVLGTLAISILGSALTGSGVTKAGKTQLEQARIINAASSLTNFEVQMNKMNLILMVFDCIFSCHVRGTERIHTL